MRTVLGPLTGAALLLVMGFFLWRQHNRILSLETQLEQTDHQRASLLTARDRPHPSSTPRSDAPAARPLASTAVPPPPIVNQAPSPRPLTEPERKFRAQVSEMHRWNSLGGKADLLRALNLPPEKAGPLKDLLVERDYAERDARDAARGTDLNPNAAAASENAKIDARIRELLGESDYAKYADLTALDYHRRMVDTTPIPGSLLDAGFPLTDEQKNWMARINYQALGPESANVGGDSTAAYRAFRSNLLAQAPGNLSASQIAALQDYFRKEDEMAAQMQLLVRERAQPK